MKSFSGAKVTELDQKSVWIVQDVLRANITMAYSIRGEVVDSFEDLVEDHFDQRVRHPLLASTVMFKSPTQRIGNVIHDDVKKGIL